MQSGSIRDFKICKRGTLKLFKLASTISFSNPIDIIKHTSLEVSTETAELCL